MSLTVNKNYFIDRATRIYNAWNADDDLKSVDSLIFCVGTNQDESPYSKSQSIQVFILNPLFTLSSFYHFRVGYLIALCQIHCLY